jgi:hypothetical protein
MKSFSRVQTLDRTINQLQDNLGKAINDLNANPLSSGVLLEGVDLVSGDNTIYTTLPQALTGWIVVRMNTYRDIYDKQDSNTNSQTLILNSTGTTTVSLFVF